MSTLPEPDERELAHSNTALFIRRPILAFVLNALILIAGLAALYGADVRELPDVDSPVITVTTTFDGASSETIDQEVTDEIEGAASRVAGVKSISASSRFGRSQVTVEFNDDTNLDVAASDMRDSISRIRNNLPDDADEPRIVKADANSEAVMRVAVTSPRRSAQELTQLVEDQIESRLLAAPGVADLQIYGDRAPIFRVDIDLMQLASRGLTLASLRTALANVAYDAPAGSLTSDRQSLVVRTTATVSTPAAFEALEIAPNVRLGDVASVEIGPEPGASYLRANGQNGVGLGIIRQAQSNTLEISKAVREIVAGLQDDLPDDVRIFVTSDDATFINGAIHEVEIALGISVLIVVAIIYLFLRDFRATLIPTLAIPVALVGTLAAIWLAGFSINILTLLALVLATGMVVDDAIVVLENIVRWRSQGIGARAAAVLGTQQVFFAVIATTTTLAAVFIPLSFLPGQTGGLFREFGFTLAISVLLSSITALSLCPVLASRFLRAGDGGEARGPVVWLGRTLAAFYRRTLHWALDAPFVVLAIAAGFALTATFLFGTLKQELTPPEDRSVILMSVQAPQGVALDYTDRKMREIEDLIGPLRDRGEVVNVFAIAGSGSRDNRGFMVISLAPWEARDRSQQEIAEELNRGLRDIVGIRAFAIQPNSLGVRGAGQGLSFAVVGDSYARLAESAQQLVERMEENPAFGQVRLGYETTQPQLYIEVDRTRASDLGIEITGLGDALQAVLDGRTVGTVFLDDSSYDIQMLSTAEPVNDPGDLERIFVQAGDGQMVPISSFVTLTERAVAPELSREGQLRAVPVTASLTPAMALGEALDEVERLAADILPGDSRIEPLAEAATLGETSSGLTATFGFAIVIVLLVLAAQFESFVSAFIVMATVPLGLACAVFALVATGGSLNVYSQIGLVLLVGIMAKNGILIVEFANQLRDEGYSVRQAIEDACAIRLRPVMMTMIATVLGGLPLVLAFGAGAEAREVLGWIIVGGLGLATIATLYLTPVAYLLLAGLSKPKAEEQSRLLRELHEATQPGAKPAEPVPAE
ncbi:efflux RND transporter permease subunit [Cereibacter azotoformans]|uniref:HAE1 family hydrophobic/amphiphilic exporter-1 n=1 Tax=Cereibacter azotoformans TaxID=43057 RepID=A0A2T5KC43_9RHOB|nr:efflux RND transporter permease subunit [Cereibacter azotoformans]AXQ94151.1 efflux RND transporter permease subunit [Cereibacter sphaeroides]MBO4168044.1 efflux RND transporter permease subunit [Cereibacter azotoformans]PTR19979.1 HAE1 family hydrophobic/amphiphilic exporter-1 [Cereibacter azotoformans]UIJ29686.1 efflux RND transporter permease subunit [Cereibacter azotoformans]